MPQVAIRRNVLPDASLDELEARGTIDRAMHSLLASAMRAGMRVIVSGETGAGKTTLLRAMTNVLPPTRASSSSRTRASSTCAPIRARAASVLEWETREANIEGVGEIAQRELVRHALRFNPEWLIVGEVRDGDAAREMLLAMQHGHPSLSTVHHHSALSAWKKLAQYVAQGSEAVEFPIAALLISDAVDFFVHLGRDRQGRRAVTEICEVAGWNGAEVQLNRLFVAGPDGRGIPQPHLTDQRRTKLRDARLRGPPPAQRRPGGGRRDGVAAAGRARRRGRRPRRARRRRRVVRPARPSADGAAPPAPAPTTCSCARRPGRRGATVVGLWTRWLVAAAAAGLPAGWRRRSSGCGPAGGASWRARRPIAIWAEMLRDLLVSNAGLHEAIGKSARVAPAAIRDEVRALYVRAQRGDLSAALARFAADMDDPIADTVVTALQIAEQRAVSDLGELLGAVATSTRETVAMQLRINATRARTYRTAQLIAGIVAFFVGLLVVTNRDVHGAVRHVRRSDRAHRRVRGIVAAALWGMVVLSRPARAERLLRVGADGREAAAR